MRPTLRRTAAIGVLALVTVLGGCSDAAAPEDDASTAPTEQTQEPAPTAEPTPEPTTAAPVVTTLPPEAMLTGLAFDSDGVEPVVIEPLDAWALPESCAAGGPSTAVVSRGVAYGDGAFEATVSTQQVAVFADADAATTEAQRLADVLSACAGTAPDGQTVYAVEDVAVGAQGTGLVVDYYGASATGSGDDALGYYLVTTRRGNAVTLVGNLGGEASIGTSREDAVASSQAAWELLCIYDSAGC